MTTRRPLRRLRLTTAAAATLAVLAPTAAMADQPTTGYEVDGRVVYRTADLPSQHGDGHFEEGSVTTAYAEVDGAYVDLSAVQAPTVGTGTPTGLPAGSGVTVTIEAPAGLAESEVVDLVTTASPDDATGGDAARVVDAVVTESGPHASSLPTAGLVSGVHQLVVVPVRWSATDAVPTAALTAAASGTEEYWERQSGGRIDVQPTVAGAVTMPRDELCDVDAIMDQVVAATGIAPSTTRHVAAAFPEIDACEFSGLASITGGAIWLNGDTSTYVLAHELGHNLGLGHANTLTCRSGSSRTPLTSDLAGCTAVEYGDNTDVMGQGRNLSSPGSISSGFAQSLGWADVVTVPGPPAIFRPMTVDLQPLSQATGVRGVRLTAPAGPVFVDYRPAVGADALHEPGWAGVQARLILSDSSFPFPTSYLLDLQPARAPFTNPSLPAGQTWRVSDRGTGVTTTSLGAAARVVIEVAPGAAQDERYVTRVYQDLFGRAPDPTGLSGWTWALAGGTPRIAVANSITGSDEYRAGLIAGAYRTYLDRGPDPVGSDAWLAAMRGGSTIQGIESGFIASSEYYQRAGGTDAAWVSRLYRNVLNREAAPSEVATWTRQLTLGASRQTVATGFLLSSEHLTTVVDGYYVALLGRHIDPTGQAAWVAQIQGGVRVETIMGGIIASDEYYARV
ncbi:DUF4214 domain-containing protein [Cellulomonas sp. PS-H5]|uniref:DUF4214 domain-containing protein n=1 Tax=Cellulomonas sp. PS-H5 TaxID=2820400 RepID=UPI001C4F52A0|nr:DUF4214 domain-containing protein [Cellulomonas sp. PS-H5]MBW0254217.1 DUF4214 domain-containing protein [Cellulomonas sp. PS-H5]